MLNTTLADFTILKQTHGYVYGIWQQKLISTTYSYLRAKNKQKCSAW